MKKKPLTYYLALMKSALEKKEWNKAKRYGETAVKQLNKLSHSHFEKYLLYCRLSSAHSYQSEYSKSLDMVYKAHIVASKNNFAPEYRAYVLSMMGNNFSAISNFSQALKYYKKVEEYYQEQGDKKPPMDRQRYVINLIGQGFCYLYQGNTEELKRIVEEKLQFSKPLETDDFALMNYYKFIGAYYMLQKDYEKARQSFEEMIKASENFTFPSMIYDGKINLVRIKLMNGEFEESIVLLKSIIKEVKQLGFNKELCDASMILSKCYLLNNMTDMAERTEKSIKSILGKVDTVWLYEKSRRLDELYNQLRKTYKDAVKDSKSLTRIIKGVISHHYNDTHYRNIVIGQTKTMMEIYQLIEKIAPTDLPVLIQGETGTGKELIARTIYYSSDRCEKPWVALNCGAVPETLLETELFGHVKGAFTDAQGDRRGCIEVASNGTLFLDEISEMSLAMQQKLLRVLEEELVWRVGAEKPVSVNNRFIFASNQNIEELVKTKKFRLDLFYRINTITITLPPLRDRKDDIPLLVKHFLSKYSLSDRPSSIVHTFSSEALKLLVDYSWPGNIRELENEIKRISILYPDIQPIKKEMLSESIRYHIDSNLNTIKGNDKNFKELRETFESKLIIEALQNCNGNIGKAAIRLGYLRSNLYRKIKQFKIPIPNNVTKR